MIITRTIDIETDSGRSLKIKENGGEWLKKFEWDMHSVITMKGSNTYVRLCVREMRFYVWDVFHHHYSPTHKPADIN